MRQGQSFLVVVVAALVAVIASHGLPVNAKKITPTSDAAKATTPDPSSTNREDVFSILEENPEYEQDEYDSDDEHDDDADDEQVMEQNHDVQVSKAAVNQALASNRTRVQKAMALIKKHRIRITLSLVVIAFHREIRTFLVNKLAPPSQVDPETGRVLQRQWMKRADPVQILKLVVFIDVMRQLQQAASGSGGGGKSVERDPLMIALLLLGAKNPVVASIIAKTLFQENNSHVPVPEQHYTFERINDRYEKDVWALQKAAHYHPHMKNKKHHGNLPPALAMLYHLRETATASKNQEKQYNKTVIVLDLTNINTAPCRIDLLRDEVSFLIHQHQQKAISYSDNEDDNEDEDEDEDARENLEVVVILESPGGGAADFALASQQLLRLRQQPGIIVTVCVDRVAASGGYMIACASSPGRLFAAPFAVLGSIGVIGQAINVQKLLDGWGIQGMVFKAGKEKAPGGLIGDVSKRDKKSIQSIVDETHVAFKRHVAEARPRLAKTIELVSTGKIWLGYDALGVGLIDRIVTSDEYIREQIEEGARVLKLIKHSRKRSLFGGASNTPGVLDSQILNLKAEAKRAWNGLTHLFNLPMEDLDDVTSMTSRLPHTQVVTKEQASLYSTSAHLS